MAYKKIGREERTPVPAEEEKIILQKRILQKNPTSKASCSHLVKPEKRLCNI